MGILLYNHKTNKAYLGEGNTRLAAAKSLGYTHMPVRAYRMGHENPAGKTVKKPYTTDPDKHVPADIKPSELGFSSL